MWATCREPATSKLVTRETKYAKEKSINWVIDFPVRYERIKFLVVGIENSLSIYAWAPRPYSKFMAFKVSQASSNPFAE
jgi:hypothetical protein